MDYRINGKLENGLNKLCARNLLQIASSRNRQKNWAIYSNQWTDIIPRELAWLHGINARNYCSQVLSNRRLVVGR